jgi:hypothetical protein
MEGALAVLPVIMLEALVHVIYLIATAQEFILQREVLLVGMLVILEVHVT